MITEEQKTRLIAQMKYAQGIIGDVFEEISRSIPGEDDKPSCERGFGGVLVAINEIEDAIEEIAKL